MRQDGSRRISFASASSTWWRATSGLDPLEFRRKNLITADELPYSIGALVPYEHEAAYDLGDYHATLDRCLAEFGWKEKQPLQGRMIDGRYHGVAVTCFVQSGGGGPPENARLSVEADGRILLGIGSSSLGQGIETTFTQVTADALGLPVNASASCTDRPAWSATAPAVITRAPRSWAARPFSTPPPSCCR